MLLKDWIKPSTGQYNHSILFSRKKDGKLRMFTDYCKVNNDTVVNCYLLSGMENVLNGLDESMVYSKFDLASSYYQLAIESIYTYRTAF